MQSLACNAHICIIAGYKAGAPAPRNTYIPGDVVLGIGFVGSLFLHTLCILVRKQYETWINGSENGEISRIVKLYKDELLLSFPPV